MLYTKPCVKTKNVRKEKQMHYKGTSKHIHILNSIDEYAKIKQIQFEKITVQQEMNKENQKAVANKSIQL